MPALGVPPVQIHKSPSSIPAWARHNSTCCDVSPGILNSQWLRKFLLVGHLDDYSRDSGVSAFITGFDNKFGRCAEPRYSTHFNHGSLNFWRCLDVSSGSGCETNLTLWGFWADQTCRSRMSSDCFDEGQECWALADIEITEKLLVRLLLWLFCIFVSFWNFRS